MGMIGVGGRGSQVHELFLNDSRIQCMAVCDVDSQRCGQAKARVDSKHGNRDCIEYGDFRRLLDRADVELGCRAAVICHMGNIAQWLRRPLKWDPAKEEFIGDEEANLWLDRAKREPWTI